MKSVLITGASGGIGFETAKLFAKNHYWVHGISATQKGADKLSDYFRLERFHKCDVRHEEQIQRVLDKIKPQQIDVLINNAATKTRGRLEEIATEDFERDFDVNVKGIYLMIKQVIPIMKRQGGGRIINVASTVGYRGCPNLSSYSASKHAVVGLSHSARDELLEDNIKVDVLYPGATNTPFNIPKPGQMKPTEVAEAIYWMANRSEDTLCELMLYPKMEFFKK